MNCPCIKSTPLPLLRAEMERRYKHHQPLIKAVAADWDIAMDALTSQSSKHYLVKPRAMIARLLAERGVRLSGKPSGTDGIAELFGVTPSAVRNWIKRHEKFMQGEFYAKTYRKHRQ